jgi:hypothetical protein
MRIWIPITGSDTFSSTSEITEGSDFRVLVSLLPLHCEWQMATPTWSKCHWYSGRWKIWTRNLLWSQILQGPQFQVEFEWVFILHLL